MFPSLNLSPLCQINMLVTGVRLFEYFSYDDHNLLTFIFVIFMELHQRNVSCNNRYRILHTKKSLFFHKIIPRTTSRMTTITDVTATAMVEVSGNGVLAWTLEDVVVLVL